MAKKLIDVDEEIYKKLKIYCVEKDIIMKELMDKLFKEFLEKKKK